MAAVLQEEQKREAFKKSQVDFYTRANSKEPYSMLQKHIEKLTKHIEELMKHIEKLRIYSEEFRTRITKLEIIKDTDLKILIPHQIPSIENLKNEIKRTEYLIEIISDFNRDSKIYNEIYSESMDIFHKLYPYLLQHKIYLEHEIKYREAQQRSIACTACTFKNPAGSINCEICQTSLPKEGGAVNYKTKYLKYKSKNRNF